MLSRFATLGGVPTDPYWSSVSYLLVGNGANGTTTNIKDSSSNNVATTISGNTVISTAQSQFGSGSSVYFDGSGDYLTLANSSLFNFGTGDFTIEGWFYFTTIPSSTFPSLFQVGGGLYFNFRGSSTIALTDTTTVYAQSSSGITSGSWHYIAVVRGSGVSRVYVNGTGGTAVSCTVSFPQGTPYVFADPGTSAYNAGYLYDLRITKGVARYTGSTMTVPTGPLPTQGP
jgi:hypothetical protein